MSGWMTARALGKTDAEMWDLVMLGEYRRWVCHSDLFYPQGTIIYRRRRDMPAVRPSPSMQGEAPGRKEMGNG